MLVFVLHLLNKSLPLGRTVPSVSPVRWQKRSKEVIRAICPSRSEPKLPTASVRSAPLSSGSPSESTSGSFGSTSQTWSTSVESTSTSTSLQDPFQVQFERHRKLLGSKSAPPGLEMFLMHDNDNIPGSLHRQVRWTCFGTWVCSPADSICASTNSVRACRTHVPCAHI